mmetsp:Transcript_109371/g.282749  ORF Transcript_109371/g.282749 Transcript_109371/m.282749 type:complete len:203 (+) Transcript_109371:234-842(+)
MEGVEDVRSNLMTTTIYTTSLRRRHIYSTSRLWSQTRCILSSARGQELHTQTCCKEPIRIHLLSVGGECLLLLIAVNCAYVLICERLHLAVVLLAEAHQLAHVRLCPKLIDPIVFDNLEVFLPRLIVLGEVGERDHLSIEPQAWLHRLKHRGVLNVDEAKLTWQVPHEVLVVGAVQLHPTQEVHRLEPFGRVYKVGRCQGCW